MIANYHTHTFRCGHADLLPDEDFVKQAIKCGFQILGFADHSPWPYRKGATNPGVRMQMEMLPGYIESIRTLQEKYHDQIHIYLGLECEYFPDYLPWLEEIKEQLDYLILGNHWPLTDENGEAYFANATKPDELEKYYQYTIEAMHTGIFSYVAHPDICLASYQKFDNDCIDGSYRLCREAKRLDMPLEYNLYGLEKRDIDGFRGLGYPCKQFWEIAKEVGCKAIIGYDAHFIRQLSNPFYKEAAERALSELGIDLLQVIPGME